MTCCKTAGTTPELMGWIGVPLRLAVGFLFIWAAWNKVGPSNGPQVFSASILAYRFELPDHLVTLATFGVPWTELLVGTTIILGVWTRASASVIAGMLMMFIGLGVSAIMRGLEIKCGCFGDRTLFCSGGLGWCHVIQNCVFTLMALAVLAWPRPALALDNVMNRRKACCNGPAK